MCFVCLGSQRYKSLDRFHLYIKIHFLGSPGETRHCHLSLHARLCSATWSTVVERKFAVQSEEFLFISYNLASESCWLHLFLSSWHPAGSFPLLFVLDSLLLLRSGFLTALPWWFSCIFRSCRHYFP